MFELTERRKSVVSGNLPELLPMKKRLRFSSCVSGEHTRGLLWGKWCFVCPPACFQPIKSALLFFFSKGWFWTWCSNDSLFRCLLLLWVPNNIAVKAESHLAVCVCICVLCAYLASQKNTEYPWYSAWYAEKLNQFRFFLCITKCNTQNVHRTQWKHWFNICVWGYAVRTPLGVFQTLLAV